VTQRERLNLIQLILNFKNKNKKEIKARYLHHQFFFSNVGVPIFKKKNVGVPSFRSMVGTIYVSMVLHSYFLSVIFSVLQVCFLSRFFFTPSMFVQILLYWSRSAVLISRLKNTVG
jgi:hypothetical protein